MNNFVRGTFGKPTQQTSYQPTNNAFQYTFKSPYQLEKKSFGQNMNRQKIISKLNNLSEQFYEVIFLKENIMSLVGQQRVKMGDFMRQLKKYLFQFGVRAQRQHISKQSKKLTQSSVIQPNQSSRSIIASNELQIKYDQLLKQNEQLKQKYESMLIRYRSEIQQLSTALVKPLQKVNNGQQSNQLKFLLLQSQEQLKQQQTRFAEKVRYLQSQIIGLQDQYLRERQMYEKQLDQYRQRQRHLSFQQSQIQRKNILLIEREKIIAQRQIINKQERATLDRRQNKISDYQHNQLRREKQKQQQQRLNLRSQYFINYQQAPVTTHSNRHIDAKTERQKSSGGRLVNSRIDINARLREIQMEKKGNGTVFKNSRMSQAGMRSDRSSSKNKNQLIGYKSPPTVRKQGTSNVNIKLQSMLQSLQRDLTDMN